MRKAAFVEITVSLLIALAYVYLFGVVGTVERMPQVIEEETASTDETTTTTTAATETTPEYAGETVTFPSYTSLDVSNPDKPFTVNQAVTYPAGHTEPPIVTTDESAAATTTTEDDSYVIGGNEESTTTTTAATTTTEATTTTPQTTTASEEAPLDDPNAGTGEHGTLTVYYTGSGGNVTGDAVDILSQVVMGEIGGSFDEEAIKAQAIAAYTYIKYYNDNGNAPYVAVRTPNDKVRRCVSEVIGKAVYYNGTIIQAVYGASSAGYTASSLNVWGVDYPYLKSTKCELDALYDPNYGVKTTFTSNEIKNYVKNATGIVLEGDPGNWFAIKEYVDNVYVGTLSIGGHTTYTNSSGKTVNITGRVLREQIMNYNLRSACFEITYSADTDKFTFTTYGYGHGVGLSQHGANNLATYWGYDYRQILQFYYPGTEIR
ncbi:MAG: SpoIID/LytB domain-containing protein [Oscillospiraceae bacterium]|nr:SpoIID/LytB domain-containing protein [Oscillospiraceae bacterium]